MPTYRVTVRTSSVHIIHADNPYMAAITAADRNGDTVEVTDVRPAVGRAPANTAQKAKKATKIGRKRELSPETRAKLAQNAAKARAARAKKLKAAKKTTNKRAKKT